jgi:hypothetical protein
VVLMGAAMTTKTINPHSGEPQRTPRAFVCRPTGSLDAEVRLAVEGVRPLGVVILDPRTGEKVAL